MLKTECGLNHHHHHTLHHSPLTTIFLTSLKHTEGSHQNKIKISKQLKKVLDISWSQHSDQTSTVHYWDTTTHSMSRERGLLDSVTTTFYNKLYFMFLSSANVVSTGPTCQFLWFRLSVCLSLCVSGLFFKACNWLIYWLLTVDMATYLSD